MINYSAGMHTDSPSSRGDQTRESLLQAAIEVFGHDGYHAASTRAIARAAGVNQALIGYHFGGKQGLYLAAFESIREQVGARLSPLAQALLAETRALDPHDPATPAHCIAAMEALLGGALELFCQASSSPWVRLIMREQLDPDQGFEILYRGVFGDLLTLLTALVGLATQRDAHSEAVKIEALMLLGMMLVFLVARGTTSQQLGWTELGAERIDAVKQQLGAHLHARFAVSNVEKLSGEPG